MEAFRSRRQAQPLDRRVRRTRPELANALVSTRTFHNRQRRRSSLGVLTPVELESRRASVGPTRAA